MGAPTSSIVSTRTPVRWVTHKCLDIYGSRISGFEQPFIASVLSTASFMAGCDDHPKPPVDGSLCPTE